MKTGEPAVRQSLDTLHHVAIPVKRLDETVDWYLAKFSARVLYRDATWALLEFANIQLAFVIPEEHPPHVAFERDNAHEFGRLTPHRDGTQSTYVRDPSGNAVEILSTLRVAD